MNRPVQWLGLSFSPIPPEASKKILQYLAQCSGHRGEVDRVKDRLLQSNPVLEVKYEVVWEEKQAVVLFIGFQREVLYFHPLLLRMRYTVFSLTNGK